MFYKIPDDSNKNYAVCRKAPLSVQLKIHVSLIATSQCHSYATWYACRLTELFVARQKGWLSWSLSCRATFFNFCDMIISAFDKFLWCDVTSLIYLTIILWNSLIYTILKFIKITWQAIQILCPEYEPQTSFLCELWIGLWRHRHGFKIV